MASINITLVAVVFRYQHGRPNLYIGALPSGRPSCNDMTRVVLHLKPTNLTEAAAETVIETKRVGIARRRHLLTGRPQMLNQYSRARGCTTLRASRPRDCAN